MKKILLALLLCLPFAAWSAPMTNDDVIRMVKGGLGDTTVLQAIAAAEPAFDTSPDGLIRLKQGGVSDTVIQRILARRGNPPAGAAPIAPPVCVECGTVTAIREIEKPRKMGGGTAAGAAIGGVLGYALGGHNHRGAGTVVGAAGGAVAGNVIENKASANRTFEIGVHFDDGNSRVYTQESHPGWRHGSRVRLVNGALTSL